MNKMEESYLFRLKKQQIKMVQARGYNISHEEWILDENTTVKKFIKKLIEQYGEYPLRKLMYGQYVHPNKPKKLVVNFICYNKSKKIKINEITPFFFKLTEENTDGLLIINSTLSPTATECNSIITEHEYQIFQEHDLLYDVTDHNMVPKHTLLNNKEIEELGLSGKKLRLLQSSDPVCQYYNFPIGSIIKIESNTDLNLLCRTLINYRIVVKSL